MNQFMRRALPIHPAVTTANPALAVEAAAWREGSVVSLQFQIQAARTVLVMPTPSVGERRDGLWQHTCCELFLGATTSPAYIELNVSPSGDWALYHFSDYRKPAAKLTAEPPTIHAAWKGQDLWVDAAMDAQCWDIPWLADRVRVGLSAVLEFNGGERAYHAIAHPRDVPDFHDVRGWCGTLDCFQKAHEHDANGT